MRTLDGGGLQTEFLYHVPDCGREILLQLSISRVEKRWFDLGVGEKNFSPQHNRRREALQHYMFFLVNSLVNLTTSSITHSYPGIFKINVNPSENTFTEHMGRTTIDRIGTSH